MVRLLVSNILLGVGLLDVHLFWTDTPGGLGGYPPGYRGMSGRALVCWEWLSICGSYM